jgi:endonuclease YncB( thermonuclease family)
MVTFALLLAPSLLYGDDWTVKVVSALDGYTIEVLHNTHPERVRLCGDTA